MLGVSLFQRSTRGTQPTVAGRSLMRFARSVLTDYERTRDEGRRGAAAGLPDVVRERPLTAVSEQLVKCLREEAAQRNRLRRRL